MRMQLWGLDGKQALYGRVSTTRASVTLSLSSTGRRRQRLVAALFALSSAACAPIPEDDAATSDFAGADVASEQPQSAVAELQLIRTRPSAVSFAGIGTLFGGVTASWAADVSAGGDVVVGWSAGRAGDEAFRWTATSGIRSLGAGGGTSRAYGVSPDGAIVTGAATPFGQPGGAAIWHGDSPLELLGGAASLPGETSSFAMSAGHAVTDGGLVYGNCDDTGNVGGAVGCSWSAPGQLEALAASHVFAGDDVGNFAGSDGAHAIMSGEELPYATPCMDGHECRAEARAFSQGATVVVGISRLPSPDAGPAVPGSDLTDTAFVHTERAGTQPLPQVVPDQQGSGAYDVSADGRVIGGSVSSAAGSQAVVWFDRKPYLLTDLLRGDLRESAAGWRLLEVRAVSADGKTVVGNGTNPSGRSEAFRVVLTKVRRQR